MSPRITDQQRAVIEHPLGKHARVLAVAGAGKTFTLVERIRRLITELNVDPGAIRVLMFNRAAREQFEERLACADFTGHVAVNTFHSLAFQFLTEMMRRGVISEKTRLPAGDSGVDQRRWFRAAVRHLRGLRVIPNREYDMDRGLEAIATWKNMLVPPERAGHRTTVAFERIYAEYELERMRAHCLTFDDVVPVTVSICREHPDLAEQSFGGIEHLLVDEYQDINTAQQIMLEWVAGTHADVMVVGDDDQTIYEWRGARPGFILTEFPVRFAARPTCDYTLSRTFRFGPLLAQVAQNVIRQNSRRALKVLQADAMDRVEIDILTTPHDSPQGAAERLADIVIRFVRHERVLPRKIAVLCRMYAQLNMLQAVFLACRIPFRVTGRAPFFRRRECVLFMDYIEAARGMNRAVDDEAIARYRNILNQPGRRLPTAELEAALNTARQNRRHAVEGISRFARGCPSHWSAEQRRHAESFHAILSELARRIDQTNPGAAGETFGWLADALDSERQDSGGECRSEDVQDRIQTVTHFVAYARSTRMTVSEFIAHINGLDTTQGMPEDQVIEMTSVFRTKGLEFDYVLIPDCHEYAMPCLVEADESAFDRSEPSGSSGASPGIENERRLFYVAITRARRGVFIGCTLAGPERHPRPRPSRFIAELQLEVTRGLIAQVMALHRGDESMKRQIMATVAEGSVPHDLMMDVIGLYVRRLTGKEFCERIRG